MGDRKRKDEDRYDFSLDEGGEDAPARAAPAQDDGGRYDFSLPELPQQSSTREEWGEPNVRMAPTEIQGEPEPWYAPLLDKGAAYLAGLSYGGAANDPLVQRQRPDLAAQSAQVQRDNPVSRGLGEFTTDVAASALAPGNAAGQAAAGALTGWAGELGRTGDPARALGAAAGNAVVGGAAGKLLGAVTGPAAKTRAIKQLLTRGSPEAESALDRVLGAQFTRGTGGSGVDYAAQRVGELMPGKYPAPEALRAAANQAAAMPGPGVAAARLGAPRNTAAYEAALQDLATDPRGAGFLATNPDTIRGLERARSGILSRVPEAQEGLRQWTADSLFSGMPTGARPGAIESVLNAMAGSRNLAAAPLKGAWEAGKQALQHAPFSSAVQGGGRIAATLGGEAGAEFGATAARAYAGEPSVNWSLQSVLSSGDTGLPPQDEQELTEAVIGNDMDRVSAAVYRMSMKYPEFHARMERTLRDLNQESGEQ